MQLSYPTPPVVPGETVPVPSIGEFPMLGQFPYLALAVENIGIDNSGITASFYARAEWFLQNGWLKFAEDMDSAAAALQFFNAKTNPDLSGDLMLEDDTELELLCMGEGGDIEILEKLHPFVRKLSEFLNEVFDGDECPHHSLYMGNSYVPDLEPKFMMFDTVILPFVVYELDEFDVPQEEGRIVEIKACGGCGGFHGIYVVQVETDFNDPDDDGVREVHEMHMRLANPRPGIAVIIEPQQYLH